MKSTNDYIGSGILELYVLGETTPEETAKIAQLAAADPLLQKEITKIEIALEKYASSKAIDPDPLTRVFTLAAIDSLNRIQGGEQFSITPTLNENSRISDYSLWLDREDMVLPDNSDSIYAKILTHTPEFTCAILWVKEMIPPEVHEDVFEKFLILEGSCTFTVGEESYQLESGDFFEVPLHQKHQVLVTSKVPCKAILQRSVA